MYFEPGILKDWVTNEDMLFLSSSAATTFILGYSKTGKIVKVLALGS